MTLHFAPDHQRARQLDRAVRRSVADSLVYLAEVSAEYLMLDSAPSDNLVRGLRQGVRFGPAPFGLYAQFVHKLVDGDRKAATALWKRLGESHVPIETMQVIGLDDPALAPDISIYTALMGEGDEDALLILPPQPERVPSFLNDLDAALKLLNRICPDLAGEIDALVTQLVMVSGTKGGATTFDGGSCYMLWGGLFINIDRPRSILELLEVLVHEAAHMLLYGFTIEEPLVTNPDEDLYPSPLRIDSRPMDGIFHATWVSARMYWAMETLLASGVLDAASRAEALKAQVEDRRNFDAGMEVVQKHGQLTMTGRALMESADQAIRCSGKFASGD
ncbi:HEXXH motif-containing putative peptide modification protein [Synechococcus sp. CS-603]|uniref:aKG-HExxH-type peptide beta-hydroxylase n=1 Tax=Synechococcus sp. CS-603 TaxID=2847981 RepID=UPI00223B6AF3|nr:HEXXH motif-containing putative peptide modification protein [Synechococcus sp. CS-603]MCT0201174.1 hypothetical protein [Synechococcus sp. CS-603]